MLLTFSTNYIYWGKEILLDTLPLIKELNYDKKTSNNKAVM